jgi:mercuric ion transport protein
MKGSSPEAGFEPAAADLQPSEARGGIQHQRLAAVGGILGALAASSCCILPLALFSLGIGGAWIGNLTALAPYQPIFIAITLGFLAAGVYLVYLRPKRACAADEACARPLPSRMVKMSLWVASALVAAALAFPYLTPILLSA